MSSFRRTIPDFALANPLYVGASVYAFTVDPDTGRATTQLASLFAEARGTVTLGNPLTLDGDGKFFRPVYIEGPVALTVVSTTVGSHGTGIVLPLGVWRGTWAAETTYTTGDFVAWGDPDFPTIYVASDVFESGLFIEEDVADGHLVKAFDGAVFDTIRDEAVEARNQVTQIQGELIDLAADVEANHTTSTEMFAQYRASYYGPFAAPPTTRPDGSAIEDGDTYLRTTAPQGLHYRLGGSWIVPSSDSVTLAGKLDASHEGTGGTAHAEATPAVAGFLSAADKTKLDGIAASANNFTYTHPSGDGNRHVPATSGADLNKFLKSAGGAGQAPAWATVTKSDVGLSNVDNTTDLNKPISTATQTALTAQATAIAGKAPVGGVTGPFTAQSLSASSAVSGLTGAFGSIETSSILVHVGATFGSITVASGGDVSLENGLFFSRQDFGVAAAFSRDGDNGTVVSLRKDNSQIGTIGVTGSAASFNVSSDGRLKPERQFFDPDPILRALKVVRHNWLHAPDEWSYGVIAQEAFKVFPQAVSVGSAVEAGPGHPDFEPWSVDYSKFVPLLLQARDIDHAELRQLRVRVDQLEKALSSLLTVE